MLLPVKTISDLLKRERNWKAIGEKIGITGQTVARIAKNDSANIDAKTLGLLSDYFVKEFEHMKKSIIGLKGE